MSNGTAQAGSAIATYRVLREFGHRTQRSFGAVRSDGLLVVLHRFTRDGKSEGTRVSAEEMAILLRDARCLAKNWHPNIALVRHVELANDVLHVATELLDGVTLAELLELASARRSLPEEPSLSHSVLARIFLDVLAGLQALHSLRDGINTPLYAYHGELCPENVVVGKDGVARLINVFRPRPVTPNRESEALGYTAPETLAVEDGQDSRVDIYATGVMLWEALMERRLYSDTDPNRIAARQREEDVARPNARLAEIAMRALAFDPAIRYRNAQDMASSIRAASGTIAPGSTVAHIVTELAGETIRTRRLNLEPLASGRYRPFATPPPMMRSGTRVRAAFDSRPDEPPPPPPTTRAVAVPLDDASEPSTTAKTAPPPKPTVRAVVVADEAPPSAPEARAPSSARLAAKKPPSPPKPHDTRRSSGAHPTAQKPPSLPTPPDARSPSGAHSAAQKPPSLPTPPDARPPSGAHPAASKPPSLPKPPEHVFPLPSVRWQGREVAIPPASNDDDLPGPRQSMPDGDYLARYASDARRRASSERIRVPNAKPSDDSRKDDADALEVARQVVVSTSSIAPPRAVLPGPTPASTAERLIPGDATLSAPRLPSLAFESAPSGEFLREPSTRTPFVVDLVAPFDAARERRRRLVLLAAIVTTALLVVVLLSGAVATRSSGREVADTQEPNVNSEPPVPVAEEPILPPSEPVVTPAPAETSEATTEPSSANETRDEVSPAASPAPPAAPKPRATTNVSKRKSIYDPSNY